MPRTVELHRSFTFEAAHRLPKVGDCHKCSRMHGHSFRVEITIRGTLDEDKGWLVDFADIQSAWDPLHERLDHRCLNDVPGLENPTSELLGFYILNNYKIANAKVTKVFVAETCRSSCTVFAE